jgi:4-diphosphocytidyl-2-C-methyl-D-erythritol kinase
MELITLLSNAKINLFFAIEGINSDNFCAVRSIVVPVSFGDNMVFALEKNRSTQNPAVEIVQHSPLKFLEKNNTITRAIGRFCAQTGIGKFSLRVDVRKKIPVGGGFGGGSSNGIFTLKILNQFHNSPLSEEDLMALGKKMGTDCPFFVKNLPQLATGRGDILSPIPESFCQNLTNYSVLIFCPPFSISTEDAYEKFKRNPFFVKDSSKKIKEILVEDHFESLLFNSFQRQILDEHAELRALFGHLHRLGYFPCVTGSGSGCFILHREYGALEKARKIVFEKLGAIPLCEITHFLRATRP